MNRTVFYIEGKQKIHRSEKCAQSTNTYRDLDCKRVDVPAQEIDVSGYVRQLLPFARVCLRCWHCDED